MPINYISLIIKFIHFLKLGHSKNLNGKAFKCECGQILDQTILIESIFGKIKAQNYLNESQARLKSYCSRYCLSGLEVLRNKNDIKMMQQYGKLDTEDDRSRLVNIFANHLNCDIDHVLCRGCAMKLNEEFKRIGNQDNSSYALKCNLCFTTHIISAKAWSGLMKNKDGGCCSIY